VPNFGEANVRVLTGIGITQYLENEKYYETKKTLNMDCVVYQHLKPSFARGQTYHWRYNFLRMFG
jgi:hypothetical protein